MELRRIAARDAAWHAPFFAFVATVFPGLGAACWQRWCERGGWTPDYEVLALLDSGRIAATVGRTRMRLVIDGAECEGCQLGAVATHPDHRGKGLARRLMDAATAGLDVPVFLFANDSVLDFYPRFGFRRIPQLRATSRFPLAPSGPSAPRCDPESAADRAWLAGLCARARPTGGRMAARDYYPVLLWHLTCRPITARRLPEADAVVAVSTEADCLVMHDVIAAAPFDLAPSLPRLVETPVARLEFRFDPTGWFGPAETGPLDDTDSALFLRGADRFAGPAQFPSLAHT